MDLVRHEISLCCLETRSASWRGVGDIFSASCSTIKTSYIAIGSQKCAQHRDCSAGELCSKAGVHGEASAPPQPRRAIFPSFFVVRVSCSPGITQNSTTSSGAPPRLRLANCGFLVRRAGIRDCQSATQFLTRSSFQNCSAKPSWLRCPYDGVWSGKKFRSCFV